MGGDPQRLRALLKAKEPGRRQDHEKARHDLHIEQLKLAQAQERYRERRAQLNTEESELAAEEEEGRAALAKCEEAAAAIGIEIGAALGVTKVRARQITEGAISKLKSAMAREGVRSVHDLLPTPSPGINGRKR